MTTSGTYSFSVTRDDIIRNAMLILGKVGDLEVPTASEQQDATMFLSMLVKQWMYKMDFAPGLKMWKRRRADLFLSNSTGRYLLGPSGDNWSETTYTTTLTAAAAAAAVTITVDSIANATSGDYIGVVLDSGVLYWTTINGAPSGHTITLTAGLTTGASSGNAVFHYTTKAQRPLMLLTAVLRDIDNNDIPIDFLTLEQYEALPSKVNTDNSGDPAAVYYESQLTNGVLYTDIAAADDVSKRLHIVYAETIQDITNPTDNPEFPQQWFLPLSWGLAKQIAPMYNAVWTQEMADNLGESLAIAREADSETTALYFRPGDDGT